MNTIRSVINWIFSTPKGAEYKMLPFLVIAWDQIYSIIVAQLLYTSTQLESMYGEEVATVVVPTLWWEYLIDLVAVVTLEELIFRIIPLIILIRYVKNKFIIILSVLVLSVAFALIHGGWEKVLLQGVGGVMYSIIFIKYSAGGTRFLQASAIVILMHIIFNLVAKLISISAGGTF